MRQQQESFPHAHQAIGLLQPGNTAHDELAGPQAQREGGVQGTAALSQRDQRQVAAQVADHAAARTAQEHAAGCSVLQAAGLQ